MVTRPQPNVLDPAADAAALLRRIGFATLVVAVPVAALVARRAAVVLGPIGVALLALAAFLDGQARFFQTIRRVLTCPAGLAALVLAGWAALSLLWTPFPATADDKVVNVVGALLLALAGAAALPDRVRASNLYLTSIGIAAASLFAIGLMIFDPGQRTAVDGGSMERGLTGLSLMTWPALAWLVSRQRSMMALALAALAVLAMLVGWAPAALAAFALGGLMFGITAISRATGVRTVGIGIAVIVLAAPALPFLLRPVVKPVLGPAHPVTAKLQVWGEVVVSEPVRLLTGHGLDASLRGRAIGELATNTPTGLPFELWYELGLVGAIALTLALVWSIERSAEAHAPLVPGIMATFATGFALACLGAGTALTWWITTVGLAIIAFVAVERGQFRTSRPKARLWTAANDR